MASHSLLHLALALAAALAEEACPRPGMARDSVLLQRERNRQLAPALRPAAGVELPELPPPYLRPEGPAAPQPQTGLGLAQRETAEGRTQPSAFEMELFDLVVQLRREGHQCKSQYFPPRPDEELLFDCRLWRAARDWSSQMGRENFFAHVKGDSTPCTRTEARGLLACSENIAAGGTTPEGTLSQWKRSNGHCLNLMDPGHNRVRLGHVATPGSTYVDYWTQSFGADVVAPDTSCFPGGSPAPPPPPPPTCFDADPNCETAYAELCYLDNIQQVCRETCGLCEGRPSLPPPRGASPNASSTLPSATSTLPSTSSPDGTLCADADPNCALHYSDLCYLDHIKRDCQETCGLCGGQPSPQPSPPPPPSTSPGRPSTPSPLPSTSPALPGTTPASGGGACADTDPNCALHYSGFCHLGHIKRDCQRTCGLCGAQPAPTAAPSPQPPLAQGCQDLDPNCRLHYAGLCYLDNIKRDCAKTCGQCE